MQKMTKENQRRIIKSEIKGTTPSNTPVDPEKIEHADRRSSSGFLKWAKQVIRVKRLCENSGSGKAKK